MADEHGVAARGVQLAVSLVCKMVVSKLPAAGERQRRVKVHGLRRGNQRHGEQGVQKGGQYTERAPGVRAARIMARRAFWAHHNSFFAF